MNRDTDLIQRLFKTRKPDNSPSIVDGKRSDNNLMDLHSDIKTPGNGNGDQSAEITEFANLIHTEPEPEITGLPPNAFPLAAMDNKLSSA